MPDLTTNARPDDVGGSWGSGGTPVKSKYGRTGDYYLQVNIISEKPLAEQWRGKEGQLYMSLAQEHGNQFIDFVGVHRGEL